MINIRKSLNLVTTGRLTGYYWYLVGLMGKKYGNFIFAGRLKFGIRMLPITVKFENHILKLRETPYEIFNMIFKSSFGT